MTDYTPTTEEVRKAWKMMPDDRYNKGDLMGQLTSGIEFDRWLAEVKAEAWEEGITAFDQAIIKDVDDPWSQLPDNPYREGENSE